MSDAEAITDRAVEIRWGPWTSLAFTTAIFLFCEILVPLIVAGILLALPNLFPSLVNWPSPLEPWVSEAGLIGLVTPVKVALSLVLFVLVAQWRGVSFGRYFALPLPHLRTVAAWGLAALVLVILFDLLRISTGRSLVPEWVSDVYTQSPSLILLFVAVVVAAPVYEELLFRGLLLPGLAHSRLGARGAVLVTAALFAAVHLQYDVFDLTMVFALGVFVGAARLFAGSTGLTILLHILMNFVALAEAYVKLTYF